MCVWEGGGGPGADICAFFYSFYCCCYVLLLTISVAVAVAVTVAVAVAVAVAVDVDVAVAVAAVAVTYCYHCCCACAFFSCPGEYFGAGGLVLVLPSVSLFHRALACVSPSSIMGAMQALGSAVVLSACIWLWLWWSFGLGAGVAVVPGSAILQALVGEFALVLVALRCTTTGPSPYVPSPAG